MTSSVKTARILLPSAIRNTSTPCAKQIDPDAHALRFYLNITVGGGTGLQVILRGYDKASGNSVELSTGGTAVTSTGCFAYEVGVQPSAAAGNIKDVISRSVPYQWDALVKHTDGTNYTYSLSVEIVY